MWSDPESGESLHMQRISQAAMTRSENIRDSCKNVSAPDHLTLLPGYSGSVQVSSPSHAENREGQS